MKLPGAMVRRIIAATVLCGLTGFVASRLALRLAVREGARRLQEPLADYLYRTHEKARCEADPGSWSMSMEHGARAYAYDAATLTSRNPEAPPLGRVAWGQIARKGAPRVALETHGLTLASGGALVFLGSERGPCAIIQTTWPAQPAASRMLAWVPLGVLLSAVAAAGVGFVALVRPLERMEQRRAQLQRHLADVAHDLKTPISSLHLALEQAIEGNRDAEVGSLLSAAMNDAVYLAALTTNLRLESEMREGWNPGASDVGVDLTDVVDRVVTPARFFARQRGVHVEVAVPDAATRAGCDPIAAEQAVSNVVENAITHGERGGHVAVLLEVSADAFTLTVADDGPGVPPAELARLGERTFRADAARRRDPRGSGIGLAITNEVCKRCRWTLAFERESPHGLRVTMHGPRQAR